MKDEFSGFKKKLGKLIGIYLGKYQFQNSISIIPALTMAMMWHKNYISMVRNFNNILKDNVLSSNFCGEVDTLIWY